MSLFLRLRLFLMGRRARPSNAFLNTLEKKLFPPEQITVMHRMRVLRFAAVPALLIVSLLAGTGSYAYSSDEVLPGDFLYPIRKNMEGLEFKLAAVTGMKDRVRIRQLERRAREKALLQEREQKPKPKPEAKPKAPVKTPVRKT